MKLAALFTLLLVQFVFGAEIPQLFVNENVLRTIDLESHLARESRKITVAPHPNAGAIDPRTFYYFTVETFGVNSTIAWLSVKEKPDEEPEYQAQHFKVDSTIVSSADGEQTRYLLHINTLT